ncbi:MAG: hypothetical protein WD871_01700 [Xanthobacteraceae bacterium]
MSAMPPSSGLSRKNRAIAACLVRGLGVQDIAVKLCMPEAAVRAEIRGMQDAARQRTEAAKRGWRSRAKAPAADWSPEEFAHLRATREECGTDIECARRLADELGRSEMSIRAKLQTMRYDDEREANDLAGRPARPAADAAPPSALIERERRERARGAQDITGLTFGDPPPGFSALDRRKPAERPRERTITGGAAHKVFEARARSRS